jgi:hypothetical protein
LYFFVCSFSMLPFVYYELEISTFAHEQRTTKNMPTKKSSVNGRLVVSGNKIPTALVEKIITKPIKPTI